MPDFSNPGGSVSSMATGNPGINMGTTGSMRDSEYASDDLWGQHDAHFREQYASRPYARADRGYEHYQPAYRYGYDSAGRHSGREWHEVEGDLEQGWHSTHGTSQSAWHDVKDAARDAWNRARGR
jgi:hypothetical protein